jgi:hypothetical protein
VNVTLGVRADVARILWDMDLTAKSWSSETGIGARSSLAELVGGRFGSDEVGSFSFDRSRGDDYDRQATLVEDSDGYYRGADGVSISTGDRWTDWSGR